MLTRSHSDRCTDSSAVYSDCETYRYSLTRVWQAGQPRLTFVMLNPSTATEVANDPTIERCEQRARRLGFGGFRVTNLFAFRATDPRDLRAAAEPVGADNDTTLLDSARWADQVIVAWGVHGIHQGRAAQVTRLLRSCDVALFHLGLSKAGHPRHPLYLPYAHAPTLWTGACPGDD